MTWRPEILATEIHEICCEQTVEMEEMDGMVGIVGMVEMFEMFEMDAIVAIIAMGVIPEPVFRLLAMAATTGRVPQLLAIAVILEQILEQMPQLRVMAVILDKTPQLRVMVVICDKMSRLRAMPAILEQMYQMLAMVATLERIPQLLAMDGMFGSLATEEKLECFLRRKTQEKQDVKIFEMERMVATGDLVITHNEIKLQIALGSHHPETMVVRARLQRCKDATAATMVIESAHARIDTGKTNGRTTDGRVPIESGRRTPHWIRKSPWTAMAIATGEHKDATSPETMAETRSYLRVFRQGLIEIDHALKVAPAIQSDVQPIGETLIEIERN